MHAKQILAILLLCILGLVLAHEVVRGYALATGRQKLLGLLPAFDLDQESNVPTFFSGFQLLLTAAASGFLAQVHKARGERWAGHWRFLSWLFVYLALDEVAMVHDRLTEPMRLLLGSHSSGWLTFAWVVPFGALTVGIALCFLNFLWHQPARLALQMAGAGATFVLGAVGVEMLGAHFYAAQGPEDLTYNLVLVPLEELLEMLGIWWFLKITLGELRCGNVPLELRILD